MVHNVFQQPTTALWVYVFVILILLVLSWVSATGLSRWDRDGSTRLRGASGFLLIAILLGVVIYFLVAADVQQWAWFVALLPTAILLFGIYFAFFAVFGRVGFFIGSLLALFLMIWLIYFAVVNEDWSLLAFPVIFFVILIMGGLGYSAWNRWSEKNPELGTQAILNALREDMM